MGATMPESWIRYFDARFHPPVVTLTDLHARGWTDRLIQQHLGFTPNVKGVLRSEKIAEVKFVRDLFLAEQDFNRGRVTELALKMIEQARDAFAPVDVSADDAIDRGYEFLLRRKEKENTASALPSKQAWLDQGHSADGWHWPAYWIGHAVKGPDYPHLASAPGAEYARICLDMLDVIDRARRFAAVPGATKWFWCEWTRLWKGTRPARCDTRWGEDDILPPFNRNRVAWPFWPQDLPVIPPARLQ